MKLRFHPKVQNDVNEVLDYYSDRSLSAADRFWDDFQHRLTEIAEQPSRFGYIDAKRGLRRVRLRKFPYLVGLRRR